MSAAYAVVLADVFNQTGVAAATNILAADLAPRQGSALRITVALSVGSVFNVIVTRGATTLPAIALNSGSALGADQLFTFTLGCSPDETYNFQVASGPNTIRKLQVDEVKGAVV